MSKETCSKCAKAKEAALMGTNRQTLVYSRATVLNNATVYIKNYIQRCILQYNAFGKFDYRTNAPGKPLDALNYSYTFPIKGEHIVMISAIPGNPELPKIIGMVYGIKIPGKMRNVIVQHFVVYMDSNDGCGFDLVDKIQTEIIEPCSNVTYDYKSYLH